MQIKTFISAGIIPKINLEKDTCFFEEDQPCYPFLNQTLIEQHVVSEASAIELSNLD